MTRRLIRVVRIDVIQCDLVAGVNVVKRKNQDVTVNNFHETVRRARMIDVLSPISTVATIDRPIRIDPANAYSSLSFEPLRDFNA